MWGAFTLSRATTEAELKRRLALVNQRNKDWKLNIPIQWSHPNGWKATVEATRQMADTYDVVYATERGARSSNHYGGDAADLIAIALPRLCGRTGPLLRFFLGPLRLGLFLFLLRFSLLLFQAHGISSWSGHGQFSPYLAAGRPIRAAMLRNSAARPCVFHRAGKRNRPCAGRKQR